MTPFPHMVTTLVGFCATYIAMSSTFATAPAVPCQNVFYTNSGCMGVDGTACAVAPTV